MWEYFVLAPMYRRGKAISHDNFRYSRSGSFSCTMSFMSFMYGYSLHIAHLILDFTVRGTVRLTAQRHESKVSFTIMRDSWCRASFLITMDGKALVWRIAVHTRYADEITASRRLIWSDSPVRVSKSPPGNIAHTFGLIFISFPCVCISVRVPVCHFW